MFLVDTNVWLERLLDQEKSEEVGRFLDEVPSHKLNITDFAFHSIGIVLTRLKKEEALVNFVTDAFLEGNVKIVGLDPEDIPRIISLVKESNLDFDDAYHCIAAEKSGLKIVSFDTDFDRTSLGRLQPAEALKSFQQNGP